MPLSTTQILQLLTAGSFERLIGEFESGTLECKGQPYDLSSDIQKLELAKDVSGF